MKSVYRIAAIAIELFTALAACVGCSSEQPAAGPEPVKTPTIHWTGPATGYEGTTDKPSDTTP